jgi:hypothetical protein
LVLHILHWTLQGLSQVVVQVASRLAAGVKPWAAY